MSETKPWDIQDYITSTERQLGYLEAAIEDGDPQLIAAALGDIAKARGMTTVAQSANVTREGLNRALSPTGDPRLSTFLGVLKALDLQMKVVPSIRADVPSAG